MNEIEYHIIGTGSSGNAVRIENIMIDCGMPYSKMKEDMYKVNTLLLTHSHGDHIKPRTLEAIRRDFPHVEVCGNAHTAYQYEVDRVVGTSKFKVKGATVIPFDGTHDVPVTCFLIEIKEVNIFYLTDSSTVPEINCPLDYVFLESNHDEKKLEQRANEYSRKGYDPYESVLRHLSTQKCKEFYYLHRRSKESVLIELHQSRRFY